jgi:ABC-type transport system involved in cytochrome c biogenesis permease subunit
MKNVLIWSRATDRRILVAAGGGCLVALAGGIGAALPAPVPYDSTQLVQGIIAAALLVFIWGTFRLARPRLHSQRWVVAEWVVVPVAWGLLVTVLGLWLSSFRETFERLQTAENILTIMAHR